MGTAVAAAAESSTAVAAFTGRFSPGVNQTGPSTRSQGVDAARPCAYPALVLVVERKEMTMKVACLISHRLDAVSA